MFDQERPIHQQVTRR